MRLLPQKGPLAYILAPQFNDTNGNKYDYNKGKIEKIGEFLHRPARKCLELVERNFKKLVVIVALTAIALLVTSIIITPAFIAPLVGKITAIFFAKPWMIKFAIYIMIQFNILTFGIRAYGRFNNKDLYEKWKSEEITAVYKRDLRA